ncbi:MULTISPECIES: Mce protein [Mycobacterium]|uniref:Mce protein n=1 Tax=Mycobacterium syngnathidarum TaxID=1908205 RepID=A0A1Q9W6F3_9MYCO|nr:MULTISPECIES: Mce protein [Mycobacterium]MCG7611422.1 Mce protein [Mycobacterium sp. CnD-18-1]OHU01426.1 Mce protein [Mycobacterium syngnathidarum]OLT91450.1 Mce protein [Mycobacterium syngnathidarum]TMS54161.1 Mce protein [Mycobacterium sp. DBP42]
MADDSADTEPVEPTETEESSQSAPEPAVPESEAENESTEAVEPQVEGTEPATEADDAAPKRGGFLRSASAGIVGGVLVVALLALTGWLGYGYYQVHQEQQRRAMFVDTARLGATNLTSIDWEHAEDDIQRVLDISTGRFYDDFERRSKSFLEVVKQIKSKSTGTVTSSGLESYSDDKANVLVSVTVRSTNAGVPEQKPQVWRMVVTVQDIEGKAKVSNVEFIQ